MNGSTTKAFGAVTCRVPRLREGTCEKGIISFVPMENIESLTLSMHREQPLIRSKVGSKCIWPMMVGDSNSRSIYKQMNRILQKVVPSLMPILEWPTDAHIAAEMTRARKCNCSQSNQYWFDREALYVGDMGMCIRVSFRFRRTRREVNRLRPWKRPGRLCSVFKGSRESPIQNACETASEHQSFPYNWLMPEQPDVLNLALTLWTRGELEIQREGSSFKCDQWFQHDVSLLLQAASAGINVTWRSCPNTYGTKGTTSTEANETACLLERAAKLNESVTVMNLFRWTSIDKTRMTSGDYHLTDDSACLVAASIISRLVLSQHTLFEPIMVEPIAPLVAPEDNLMACQHTPEFKIYQASSSSLPHQNTTNTVAWWLAMRGCPRTAYA